MTVSVSSRSNTPTRTLATTASSSRRSERGGSRSWQRIDCGLSSVFSSRVFNLRRVAQRSDRPSRVIDLLERSDHASVDLAPNLVEEIVHGLLERGQALG